MNIRVATYNFYCRPRMWFWDNQVDRARKIAKEIEKLENRDGQIDVLCLQEIVDNKVHKILKKELRKIGFLFKSKRLDTFFRLNGGLIIYSRLPIIEDSSIVYKLKDSYIWNAPASKGAICVTVIKNEKHYHVVNTHLDSFKEDLRKKQMIHMKKWLDEKSIPADESIIVCGDFNIDFYSEEKKNIDEVYQYTFPNLNSEESICNYTISKYNDWVDRRITSEDDPDRKLEFLDFFIYYSNQIKTASMKIVDLQAKQKIKKILYSSPFYFNIYNPFSKYVVNDLSDHYMCICDFS